MKKPPNYALRAGTTHPLKGKMDGIRYYVWDLIDDCKLDKCKAHSVCEFAQRLSMKKEDGTPKKCRVMYWYLKGATEVLFNALPYVDQYGVWRVGMRLLPMYRLLCRLQIAEAGLDDIICTNNRGNIVVIPIAKHIGELQIKIDTIERNLFGKEKKPKKPLPFERPMFAMGKTPRGKVKENG